MTGPALPKGSFRYNSDGSPLNVLRQIAPYPQELALLVRSLQYKEGWTFHLADMERDPGSSGLTLRIIIHCRDSYHPERFTSVGHYFPVPPATYDDRSWRRWLFDQIMLVELHEAMEFFQSDGQRPYAPSHGPGNSPYLLREVGTETDQRTSFRGEINTAKYGQRGAE